MTDSDNDDPDPSRKRKRQTLILVGIIIFVVGSYVGFKFGERHAETDSPKTPTQQLEKTTSR